jgi:hypothetical protein
MRHMQAVRNVYVLVPGFSGSDPNLPGSVSLPGLAVPALPGLASAFA